MALAILIAVPVPCAHGQDGAPAADVTGMRLGRHADFLRLVFDLTAKPAYDAHATGPRAFAVSLPGATLPPEGHAALAGDPLAPDLIVRPREGKGELGFHLTSRHDAFIRRAFVIGPPVGGVAPGAAPWRLVLDIVPRPGHRGTGASQGAVVTGLPAPHGIAPPDTADLSPSKAGGGEEAVPAAADAPAPARHVEVSWAKASRILRELQARRAPDADAPVAPQLILPPKYRRDPVPLR